MKITKFAQSCILIETNGKKILVDPGILLFDESLLTNYWNDVDILLLTHKHTDHCHQEAIKEIIKNPKTNIYSSSEVANTYTDLPIKIVKNGDTINEEGIKIEVVRAIHGYLPYLKGSEEIDENFGFVITCENKKIYITSDTVCFKNDYKCDVLLLPVSNHGLVMGPFEAALFAKETESTLVIPTHYNHPRHPVNLDEVRNNFEEQGLNYKILEIGESIEI